ncbi:RNA polymerase sigma factor [Rhodoferax sp.]|uniref:RNA polymerase sigma factor n=1 Tax=Rhodoferax sp. TaxID=50421 RepID=UPI0026146E5E|nr:RNA polymerase sigma factor [Rhodoferax sp.]MDD2810326.1 RNA polymerase sigma factor [Rhodoferax sp.]MDD4960320.1 RNA polymerase sigma factor [Gallionella sp.]
MNEEEMIISIKSGGRQQELALVALYRKAAEFRRHYQHKGLSHQLSEDLVQETILKIFKSASSFTGSGGFGDGSVNSWMWTIAKNVMNDHLRAMFDSHRVKKYDEVSLDDDQMSDVSRFELEAELAKKNPHGSNAQSARDCVSKGIEEFAAEHPDRAKALEMQLDGEDIASIARRIGRSVAASKEFLSQCKKKLSPYIEHCRPLLQP